MSTQLPAPPPANGGDPSMEDILASIRRILSEDEAAPVATEALPPVEAEDDVLVLDASMRVDAPGLTPPAPATPPPAPPPTAAAPDPFDAPTPAPSPPDTSEPVAADTASPPDTSPLGASQAGAFLDLPGVTPVLVAPEAAAAAAASVGSMVRGITAERGMLVYPAGPTIEDIVRAELRPLLKQWLDTNLPPMVERLVRAELERVIGRAVP